MIYTFDNFHLANWERLLEQYSRPKEEWMNSTTKDIEDWVPAVKGKSFKGFLQEQNDEELARFVAAAYTTFSQRELTEDVKILEKYLQGCPYSAHVEECYSLYFTYYCYKAYVALKGDELSLLLSQDLSDVGREEGSNKLRILMPIVPIKSPFSLCLAATLAGLIKEVERLEFEYKIEMGWNVPVLKRLTNNLVSAFAFDDEASFTKYETYIENNFRSFINDLLISSFSKGNSAIDVNGILRDRLMYVGRYERRVSKDDAAIITDLCRDSCKPIVDVITNDIAAYAEATPTLVEYFLEILVAQARGEVSSPLLMFVPVPLGLLLYALIDTVEKKLSVSLSSVHFVCYMPFPTRDRVKMPFYLLEYSYYLSLEENPQVGAMFRKYVENLLKAALKELGKGENGFYGVEQFQYEELLNYLQELFRKIDNRQKNYLRLI
jgi:hypothetical protein